MNTFDRNVINFDKIGRIGAAGTTTSVGGHDDPVAAPKLMATSA